MKLKITLIRYTILLLCSFFIFLTLSVNEWFVVPTYFMGALQGTYERVK